MSIIKALEKIAEEDLTSFHVPGHKNGRLLSKLDMRKSLAAFDTTEIEGTDNLHAPEEAIKEAQESAAAFYGAIESFYLVNGTTAGNIAMIYAAFQPGDKVLISRDAHKSVFTGMILTDLSPIYLSPKVDPKTGINYGICPEQVADAFKKEPDIKGLILTYPSYHGICGDIEAIEKLVHNKDALLLVDGAHGAHLNLSDDLPLSAIKAKADIVVHSTHKSLPSFTQSSILHYCSNRVSLSRLKMALSMFQSSSPSYLLMASLENAVEIAKDTGKTLMKALLEEISLFKGRVERDTLFRVLDENMLSEGYSLDATKITLLTKASGISGGGLDRVLRRDYGIQCEYGTDSCILFISSIASVKEDFNRLYEALKIISQEIQNDQSFENKTGGYDFTAFDLNCDINPSEASRRPKERVNLKASVGYPAGDFIVPYPPGIPLLVPGEVISEQVVNFIEEGIRKGYNINGVYINDGLQVNIIRR